MCRLPPPSSAIAPYLQTLRDVCGHDVADRVIEVSRWTMEIATELGVPRDQAHRMSEAAAAIEITRALGEHTSVEVVSILDSEQRSWIEAQSERWDGSGPGGLAGGDIPIGARVIALARDWVRSLQDDTTDGRSAIAALWRFSGRQFYPESVRALTRLRTLEARP